MNTMVTVQISSATRDLMLIQHNKFFWISNRSGVAQFIWTVTNKIRKWQKEQESAAKLGNRTIAFTNWIVGSLCFLFNSKMHTKWRLGLLWHSVWCEMILKFKWHSFMQPILRKLQLLRCLNWPSLGLSQKKSAKKGVLQSYSPPCLICLILP